MAGLFIQRLGVVLRRIEQVFVTVLWNHHPPQNPCMVVVGSVDVKTTQSTPFSLDELFGDGFLWAVPRNRRSIERRLKRKYGDPKYMYKMLVPKTNLLVCNTCGHHYEARHLCQHCYAKIRAETEAMQSAIQSELGLSPVEKEVVVLYDGEKEQKPTEFWQGKRIVEMKKERPSWFSKNLLEKSTVQPSSSGDVKPTELA